MDFSGIIGNSVSSIFLTSPFSDPSILFSIALVVIIAAVLALISKLLKQELILAYIVAGIIIGPLVLGLIKDASLINGFAEVGIVFLLFVAGLEMSLKKLKSSVGTSFLAGIIQVASVTIAGFFVLMAFSFSRIESIWIALAISFSSTVVITKILSDKNELNTLHARLIIGIMLVQDVLAIIALAILSKDFNPLFMLISLGKLVFIVGVAFLLNKVINPIIKKAAKSSELLFVFSLAILFLFVGLSYLLKTSIATGAFIAGILLANTNFKLEIESKTKSLRDFFSVMFFVSIGLWLNNISKEVLWPLIPMLIVLFIVEPLFTALILRIKGYATRTSLDIGFSFAQLSEFTLILSLTALGLGVISQRGFDLVVLMAVISIAATPYLLKFSKKFSPFFGHLFDSIKVPTKLESKYDYLSEDKKTILLIGCHRMGTIYLKNMEKYKNKLIVLDYNPQIIQALSKQKISCVYGDVDNEEFLKKVTTSNLKIVISTVPEKEDNLFLIKYFKTLSNKIFVVVTAQKIDDALEFYEAGADYVIMPAIISAEQSLEVIKKTNKSEFKKLKQEHIKYLKELHNLLY